MLQKCLWGCFPFARRTGGFRIDREKESEVGKRKEERRKGGESGISPVEIALTQSVFASYKEMNRQEGK